MARISLRGLEHFVVEGGVQGVHGALDSLQPLAVLRAQEAFEPAFDTRRAICRHA